MKEYKLHVCGTLKIETLEEHVPLKCAFSILACITCVRRWDLRGFLETSNVLFFKSTYLQQDARDEVNRMMKEYIQQMYIVKLMGESKTKVKFQAGKGKNITTEEIKELNKWDGYWNSNADVHVLKMD